LYFLDIPFDLENQQSPTFGGKSRRCKKKRRTQDGGQKTGESRKFGVPWRWKKMFRDPKNQFFVGVG